MKTITIKNLLSAIPVLLPGIILVIALAACSGNSANNTEGKTITGNNQTTEKTTDATQAKTVEKKAASVIPVTDNNFDQTIKSGVVLVDFWATWCKPCRMQAPIIEEVNDAVGGKSLICKMDIDKNHATANKFNIQSIPTIIIFKNGQVVKEFIGLTEKNDILNVINALLN